MCYHKLNEMKKIHFDYPYKSDGSSEFLTFIQALPTKDRVKLLAVISKTEQYGIEVAIKMKWVKKLRNNLYELRSQSGSNIQRALYFHLVGNVYMITHAFTKKTDKSPTKEIEHAINLRENYLNKRDNHDKN